MAYDTKIHRRRSLRLKGYDYTHMGAYFVTIVAQKRLCLFGDIVGAEMRLNEAGQMVCRVWEELPQRFPAIEIDLFVVMPNHLHGIIVINRPLPTKRATTRVAPTEHELNAEVGLVPAQNTDDHTKNTAFTPSRVTTRVTPTNQNPDRGVENAPTVPNRATTTVDNTKLTNVGAGLVPAQHTGDHTTKRTTTRVAPTGEMGDSTKDQFALGDVIGVYKSLTTVEYVRSVKTIKWMPFDRRLWQRNYYEHIVRDDQSLRDLQQYILDNPTQWAFDKENPLAKKPETQKL